MEVKLNEEQIKKWEKRFEMMLKIQDPVEKGQKRFEMMLKIQDPVEKDKMLRSKEMTLLYKKEFGGFKAVKCKLRNCNNLTFKDSKNAFCSKECEMIYKKIRRK